MSNTQNNNNAIIAIHVHAINNHTTIMIYLTLARTTKPTTSLMVLQPAQQPFRANSKQNS
jgi:hypothetical protein